MSFIRQSVMPTALMWNKGVGTSLSRFTGASSAATPSDQSPKVPFVARGMSLLETSSFLQEEKVKCLGIPPCHLCYIK